MIIIFIMIIIIILLSQTNMIHLYFGVSIKNSAWREIRSLETSSTASKFVSNADTAIWKNTNNILERALDPSACKNNRLPGVKPKIFTPHKLACLKRKIIRYKLTFLKRKVLMGI